MALLFMDSFDHYTTVSQKWDDVLAGTVSSAPVISAGTGRTGSGNSLYGDAGNNGSGGSYVRRSIGGSATTWIAGVGFRHQAQASSASQTIFSFYEGTIGSLTLHMELRINLSGQFFVTRAGTQVGAASAVNTIMVDDNIWHYCEFKGTCHDTTGSFEVRIDNVTVTTGSGLDTRNAGTSGVFQVLELGSRGAGNTGIFYDDLYLLDTSGSVNTTFLGDVKVEALLPNAAGSSTDFTGVPSATLYQNVDDNPPDTDTTYNESDVVGEIDLHNLAPLVTTSGSVKGIQTINRWRKDDAGARDARHVIRAGSTSLESATVALSTSYVSHVAPPIETNPDTTAAWTISDVNALQAGYKVQA